MRGPEDLIVLDVKMSARVSLDRERIIEDPAWANIADKVNLTDPEELKQALQQYLESYILRQQLFGPQVFMPSTNGPADIIVERIEGEENASN